MQPFTTGQQSIQRFALLRPRRICQAHVMFKPLATALFLSVPLTALAADESWQIDTVHTQIHFSVDHLGFTQSMGLIKAREGRLRFDPADFAHCEIDVIVDPATLLMGDAKWQETVLSWQFLNIKRWPEARYKAQRCEQTDKATGIAHGTLSMHGMSAPVDLSFHVNKIGNDPYTFKHTAGFSATARLQRSAFGMKKLLTVVGDRIDLRFEVEAVRDHGDAPTEKAEHDSPIPTDPTESDDDGAKQ
ncbi:MAG: YceI family protein [Tahibacter sp.]